MRTWELAGGLFPSGYVRFDVEDVQAAGPQYEACWVKLKDGHVYYLSAQHEQELGRILGRRIR